MKLRTLRSIWRRSPSGGSPLDNWGKPNEKHPGWTWLIQARPDGSLDYRGHEDKAHEEEMNLLTLAAAAPRLTGDELILAHLRWGRGGEMVDGAFIDLRRPTA